MFHRHFADNRNDQSVATQLRRRRLRLFLDLIQDLPKPVQVLDVGGTQSSWEMVADESILQSLQITLLNISDSPVSHPNFSSVLGDARDMSEFSDHQFEVVFSNSTIEHLGTLEDQRRAAREMMRVAPRFYVQTPNRYFPIEPHFVFPFFQFLPRRMQVLLVRNFQLGWIKRIPDQSAAEKEVASIRLLTLAELQRIFPGGKIWREKYLGLTKSFVVYRS